MKKLMTLAALFLVAACYHPIEIVGEGDVTSDGGRSCTLEDFLAALPNCTQNLVAGDYDETYTADPRDGWVFNRWENYCQQAPGNQCSFTVPGSVVDQFAGSSVLPLRAVFSRYKVTGPILPASGYSMNIGGGDLGAAGYEVEEYFLHGAAPSYTPDLPLPTDGKLVVNQNPDSQSGEYRTRMLVVKPQDPADFNGTVIVEWLNVSAGGDSPPDWIMAHNEFIRGGYAWIGVSAQAVGVNQMINGTFAARYATLNHPGDVYSYGIYSHAGMSVVSEADTLLAGLSVERVIAAGESQSAIRMVTYIDAVHPLADAYDGFLVHSRFGAGAPISSAPLPNHPFPVPAPIRDDLNVPVIVVMAEGDVIGSNLDARQPDSTLIRLWELAGTAHADAYTLAGISDNGDGSTDIQMFNYLRVPFNPFNCTNAMNAGAHHWQVQAAFRSLDTWVRTLADPNEPTVAPASAARLQVASTSPVVLARDVHGNALGGVRSPHVDAPVATLDSENTGPFFCPLFGRTIPFPVPDVLALYPTKADFLSQWEQSLDDLVSQGFLLQEDADLLEAAAQAWNFPN